MVNVNSALPSVGTLNRDSFGDINHKLDIMIGNREHGQLVQIDRALVAIPVRIEELVELVTGQVSVTSAVTLIRQANPFRRSILITNITGTAVVYFGPTNAVLTTTGAYLHSSAGSSVTLYTKGAIWGIAVVTTQSMSYAEELYSH
jgi:hypothetical protein